MSVTVRVAGAADVPALAELRALWDDVHDPDFAGRLAACARGRRFEAQGLQQSNRRCQR